MPWKILYSREPFKGIMRSLTIICLLTSLVAHAFSWNVTMKDLWLSNYKANEESDVSAIPMVMDKFSGRFYRVLSSPLQAKSTFDINMLAHDQVPLNNIQVSENLLDFIGYADQKNQDLVSSVPSPLKALDFFTLTHSHIVGITRSVIIGSHGLNENTATTAIVTTTSVTAGFTSSSFTVPTSHILSSASDIVPSSIEPTNSSILVSSNTAVSPSNSSNESFTSSFISETSFTESTSFASGSSAFQPTSVTESVPSVETTVVTEPSGNIAPINSQASIIDGSLRNILQVFNGNTEILNEVEQVGNIQDCSIQFISILYYSDKTAIDKSSLVFGCRNRVTLTGHSMPYEKKCQYEVSNGPILQLATDSRMQVYLLTASSLIVLDSLCQEIANINLITIAYDLVLSDDLGYAIIAMSGSQIYVYSMIDFSLVYKVHVAGPNAALKFQILKSATPASPNSVNLILIQERMTFLLPVSFEKMSTKGTIKSLLADTKIMDQEVLALPDEKNHVDIFITNSQDVEGEFVVSVFTGAGLQRFNFQYPWGINVS